MRKTAVKTYSKAKNGNSKLSENFRVYEFACKDGSDKVLIDNRLVSLLQQIRNWSGKAVTITSGYRTEKHNSDVGGSKSSYHKKGQAADILVNGKSIYDVAKYAEAIGAGGVELNVDKRYVHVDLRVTKYYWQRKNERNITVSTHGGKCPYCEPTTHLQAGSHGNAVMWLQWWLNLWGYGLMVDGSFGSRTERAVKDLQKRRKITCDGIVGLNTRKALKGM